MPSTVQRGAAVGVEKAWRPSFVGEVGARGETCFSRKSKGWRRVRDMPRRAKKTVLRVTDQLPRLNPALRRVHLKVRLIGPPFEENPTIDFPVEWQRTIDRVAPYTMVSPERSGALIQAVEHVITNDVPGAIVECGVWRGGSSMVAALTLQRLGHLRDLYLFDTFEGMPEPGELDIDYTGRSETALWDPANPGAQASLGDVRSAMRSTGYPAEHISFVQGRVEDTIPASAPTEIAILRLDTDWYESTRHELEHLYPRLAPGGVLIVDDYGHYEGARKAVDEYFPPTTFIHRLDYSGRLVVKV